jgi:hypothetical protein
MTFSIDYYLTENDDSYRPTNPKPELQQWDNYQINDLYCDDIEYSPVTVLGQVISAPSSVIFNNFLAVERTSIRAKIECDFELIANNYS